MKPLKIYCEELGWNISELARRAGLSWPAASHAYNGEEIQFRTKFEICKALSSALGYTVQVKDVQWKENR